MSDAPQKVSVCKFCGKEITWTKDAVSGKNYPKNLNGSPHQCQKEKNTAAGPAPQDTADKLKAAGFNQQTQPAGKPENCTSPASPVIGMTDPAKVLKVTLGCTINLHDFNNLKLEVEATDAVTAKRALIEILGITIPAESAVARECIDRYVKSVLVGKVA